jgi:hypothetical protein
MDSIVIENQALKERVAILEELLKDREIRIQMLQQSIDDVVMMMQQWRNKESSTSTTGARDPAEC